MNHILNAAIEARERGWSVMPVSREEGKLPLIKWKQFQTELPEISEVKRWFVNSPNRNLGIITGQLSGVFIIDTDTAEAMQWLESKGIPLCPIAQGSQPFKRHYYFAHPGFAVSNSVKRIHPGADVRGDGGYAVLPPSVHQTGAVYEWIIGPDEVAPPQAPQWLQEAVRKKIFVPSEPAPLPSLNGSTDAMQKYANAAFEAELSLVSHAPDGEKHSQLFKSVANVAEFIPHGLLSEGEVKAAFFAAIEHRAEDKRGALKTIEDAIERGKQQPRRLPEREGYHLTGNHRQILTGPDATEDVDIDDEPDDQYAEDLSTYAIEHGRIIYLSVRAGKSNDTNQSKQIVADFKAKIIEQIIPEEGPSLFKITGKGARGSRFNLEISSEDYADEKKLKAAFVVAAGPQSPVRAGMQKHLGTAISHLTGKGLKKTLSYARTGWTVDAKSGKEYFLLPGRETVMESHNAVLTLKEPPYRVNSEGDVQKGLQAIDALLNAQVPAMAAVALTFAFQAPLGYLADWRNERYALFITGQTGSFKSSWAQLLMALYGFDFMHDANLLKWGDGGTRNAISRIATICHDMPLLVDNYKPNTGRGSEDFVAMMHNILEGAEKRRLNKDSKLQDSRPIFTWPFVTGEDVPEEDAASLARVLIVPFAWPKGEDNPNLSKAQDLAIHLPAIGGLWVNWLESPQGRAAAAEAKKFFPEARSDWRARLRDQRLEMANPLRVATNLATNELTWMTMQKCPQLAPIVSKYKEIHFGGLLEVAGGMAHQTTDATEAAKFLAILRQLIASGRCEIAPYGVKGDREESDRVIGFKDNDNQRDVLLAPDLARMAVEKVLGPNGLNKISAPALYRQLRAMGAIASSDPNKNTKKARPRGAADSYLCLKGDLLWRGEEDE